MVKETNGRERSTASIGRRGSLELLGGAFAVAAGVPLGVGSVTADSTADEPGVSPREAVRVARAVAAKAKEKDAYGGFDVDGVGQPALYRSLTGEGADDAVPSVYVVPVRSDGAHVGHVTVGARPEMPPVVEYGTTPAPHTSFGRVEAAAPSDRSFGNRFLYQGPLSFGVRAVDGATAGGDEYFVDLERGFSYDLDAVPRVDPTAGTDHSERWDRLHESGGDVATFDVAPLDSGYVYGVPNWTDTGYSTWPGCSPIAGSMAVGHHEYLPSRTTLIDGLHGAMGTDSDGLTWPWNIPGGVESYDASYSAANHYTSRPSAATNAVDSYDPPLVSTLGDKEAGKGTVGAPSPDGWSAPVGHTETVVGYEEEGSIIGTDLYLDTHNTWGGTRTLLVGDYWDTYMITTITP